MIRIFGVFTIICATLASAGAARSDAPVTIFAAASLRGALEAALDGSGIDARVSYGGSGTMARQVAQGAPADVVILANVAWVDWLEENGHIAVSTRTDLLGNRLVLVGPRGAADLGELNADTLLERLDAGRLAVGHTEAVPAGIYAQEWMQAAGFWEALRPQLAETENVRAALALVSRGEVPLGVVYASDAQADPGVRIWRGSTRTRTRRLSIPWHWSRGGTAMAREPCLNIWFPKEPKTPLSRMALRVSGICHDPRPWRG